jgi:hypothetical protein
MKNAGAESFFLQRSAHDEVGTELINAVKPLGDYQVLGDLKNYRSPYIVTKSVVFSGASGQKTIHFRLRPRDREIALKTGADGSEVGPDWIQFTLFRADWPKVDLQFWARIAYDYARSGD